MELFFNPLLITIAYFVFTKSGNRSHDFLCIFLTLCPIFVHHPVYILLYQQYTRYINVPHAYYSYSHLCSYDLIAFVNYLYDST